MTIDISSVNSSILNKISQYQSSGKEPKDVNQQIRNLANSIATGRKGLVDYIGKADSFTLSSDKNFSSGIESAIATMRTTNGMSAIEKYKYMLEQAQNLNKIETTEPNAEKLLSESEKAIQKAFTQGFSAKDSINLNEALNAKRVALSRLNMLG